MDLGHLIILVVILGIVWWAITSYVPMPPAGKSVLTIAFVVILILALLSFLGLNLNVLSYKPHF